MQLLYEALLVNYMHLTELISYEDILKFLVFVWIQKIFQIVQVFGALFASGYKFFKFIRRLFLRLIISLLWLPAL